MAKKMPESKTANPAALSPDQLARLLAKVGGGKITAVKIQEDIDAGAPTNADRTLHLVHYAAWLASQVD